jgi:hypothetical protein
MKIYVHAFMLIPALLRPFSLGEAAKGLDRRMSSGEETTPDDTIKHAESSSVAIVNNNGDDYASMHLDASTSASVQDDGIDERSVAANPIRYVVECKPGWQGDNCGPPIGRLGPEKCRNHCYCNKRLLQCRGAGGCGPRLTQRNCVAFGRCYCVAENRSLPSGNATQSMD